MPWQHAAKKPDECFLRLLPALRGEFLRPLARLRADLRAVFRAVFLAGIVSDQLLNLRQIEFNDNTIYSIGSQRATGIMLEGAGD